MPLPDPARGTASPELLDLVRSRYGLGPVREHRELGDSFNLNLLIRHGEEDLVVRVYRPWVTVPRLSAVQDVRRFLLDGGLPFASLRPAIDGSGWCEFDGRLIEVEEFVPSQTYMESFEHILLGMPLLGRLHDRLRLAPTSQAAATTPVANHVDAARLLDVVTAGTAALRHSGRPDLARYATIAETLAGQLARTESQFEGLLPRQLVHGDYWDDNVRFTGCEVVLVTDLDFMGHRIRIDDLALTLFYANERLGRDDTSAQRIARLRALVDAYDGALHEPLSGTERHALPYAVARTPLCFMRQLIRSSTATMAEVVDRRGPAWVWALDMIRTPAWAAAFS